MRLSFNEIRTRAAQFSKDYADASYEKGETQSFYDDFFSIFGVKRRSVARYEEHVKKLNNRSGFIDLFWPKVLLVEQKSAGRDLNKAGAQAAEYFDAIPETERPRYQLLCDFQTFELLDRDTREEVSFTLEDLPKHVEKFGFIMGMEKRSFKDQDPVNIQAAELVGHLHDALEDDGYTGHQLEVFLTRLVFCLFADDTGIFEPRDIFLDFLEERTKVDGSDTGALLTQLFDVLDTPENKRQSNLDEDLARFPYVNGALFTDPIRTPAFNSEMRERLIEAARFNWSGISPAIFGSLFQSVMNATERRKAGAHYTTEKNIMKVIGPLFLDDLRAEFETLRARKTGRKKLLQAFHDKLSKLTFMDPACGCGNFLIITYRELRLLEIELLRELTPKKQLSLDAQVLSRIDVDQFYGIEFAEFPARIAETAMWMMDHIMNAQLSSEFGQVFLRIPLRKSPSITQGDALELQWEALLPPKKCSYIIGNPPFVGHQNRNKTQVSGMHAVWGNTGQVNRLDYVSCWFKKSASYALENKSIGIAFVSTNSIIMGEQAGIMWPILYKMGINISFAHRTFKWNSEARGSAAVHCVIIGMSFDDSIEKRIFEYQRFRGEPSVSIVKRINCYLVEGPDFPLPARGKAISSRPKMHKGSQPTDGARVKRLEGGYDTYSNLILDAEQKKAFESKEPLAPKWLRPFVGGDELISNDWRYCLWLKDANPSELRSSSLLKERLDRVRKGRLLSPTDSVKAFAKFPTLFTQDRQPDVEYLALPEVSSENREYLPMAFLPPNVIASNKLQIIVDAPKSLFAILISAMHMGWMRTVTGRLKSDYSYSPTVYNKFPLPVPESLSKLEPFAQAILDARAQFPNATLAELYDPDIMPAALRKAHIANDKAVDKLYRKSGFKSERERVEHLFMLYEEMTDPLLAEPQKKRSRKKAS